MAIAAEVLKTSGLMRTFEASTPNVVQMLRQNMSRTRPELVRQIEESLKVVEGKMGDMTNDGLKGAAGYLAARMTEAELKDVNTFLTSPSARSMSRRFPPSWKTCCPISSSGRRLSARKPWRSSAPKWRSAARRSDPTSQHCVMRRG